jgi:hypothetical protein
MSIRRKNEPADSKGNLVVSLATGVISDVKWLFFNDITK